MKKEIQKFLEFNGKTIFFVAADGQYWIAIKPICEALNVHYEHQRELLKKDEILSQLPRHQGVVAADGKVRKMVCLPEFYIYGWIFNIQSNSPELLKYKWECYRVLYEHFHGMIGGRKELLREKAKAQIEMDSFYNALTPDQALKLQKADKQIKQINAQLRKLDTEVLEEERNLFSS